MVSVGTSIRQTVGFVCLLQASFCDLLQQTDTQITYIYSEIRYSVLMHLHCNFLSHEHMLIWIAGKKHKSNNRRQKATSCYTKSITKHFNLCFAEVFKYCEYFQIMMKNIKSYKRKKLKKFQVLFIYFELMLFRIRNRKALKTLLYFCATLTKQLEPSLLVSLCDDWKLQ